MPGTPDSVPLKSALMKKSQFQSSSQGQARGAKASSSPGSVKKVTFGKNKICTFELNEDENLQDGSTVISEDAKATAQSRPSYLNPNPNATSAFGSFSFGGGLTASLPAQPFAANFGNPFAAQPSSTSAAQPQSLPLWQQQKLPQPSGASVPSPSPFAPLSFQSLNAFQPSALQTQMMPSFQPQFISSPMSMSAVSPSPTNSLPYQPLMASFPNQPQQSMPFLPMPATALPVAFGSTQQQLSKVDDDSASVARSDSRRSTSSKTGQLAPHPPSAGKSQSSSRPVGGRVAKEIDDDDKVSQTSSRRHSSSANKQQQQQQQQQAPVVTAPIQQQIPNQSQFPTPSPPIGFQAPPLQQLPFFNPSPSFPLAPSFTPSAAPMNPFATIPQPATAVGTFGNNGMAANTAAPQLQSAAGDNPMSRNSSLAASLHTAQTDNSRSISAASMAPPSFSRASSSAALTSQQQLALSRNSSRSGLVVDDQYDAVSDGDNSSYGRRSSRSDFNWELCFFRMKVLENVVQTLETVLGDGRSPMLLLSDYVFYNFSS